MLVIFAWQFRAKSVGVFERKCTGSLITEIEKNGAPPCGLLHCELTKRHKDLAELHSASPWNKRVYSTFSSVNSNPIVPCWQVFASLLVSTEVDRMTFSTSILPSSQQRFFFFFYLLCCYLGSKFLQALGEDEGPSRRTADLGRKDCCTDVGAT